MFDFNKKYDSWTLERFSRHLVYWMLWLLFYAAINTNYNEQPFWTWVQVELVIMWVKLPFVYFVIYGLMPRFLITKRYTEFFSLTALAGIIGGFLVLVLFNHIVYPVLLETTTHGYYFGKVGYKIVDLIYICSVPVALKLLQRQISQEKQTHKIQHYGIGTPFIIMQ